MVFNLLKRLAGSPALSKIFGQQQHRVEPLQKTAQSLEAEMSRHAKKPIVWIDCEMTGLNLHKDRLMEIACLITDSDLNITAEGPNLVIHQPDSLLQTMNSWCTRTHTDVSIIKDVCCSVKT